jgi:ATP-dependent Zn protease
MSKRMTRTRLSFIPQARKRRALTSADKRASTQSKGVKLSRDGRRSIMNRSERRWTAYHEAGHAVLHALLGIRFRLVTIVPSGHLLGRVERKRRPIWRGITRAGVRREILSLLAGGIAERLARRDGQTSGLAQDIDCVVPLIAYLPGSRTSSGRCRRLIEMHRRAEGLVRRNWDVIDQVARRLIRDKTLSECQVLRILKDDYRF